MSYQTWRKPRRTRRKWYAQALGPVGMSTATQLSTILPEARQLRQRVGARRTRRWCRWQSATSQEQVGRLSRDGAAEDELASFMSQSLLSFREHALSAI